MWILRLSLVLLFLSFVPLAGFGWLGWQDARFDAGSLKQTATRLSDQNQGANDLGARKSWIAYAQDPAFWNHSGLDFITPGSGARTLTQVVADRLGSETYSHGLHSMRQTGYALGLESRLTKDEILTLYLRSSPMGHGPKGALTGFFNTSYVIFSMPPAQLTDDQFLTLVAALGTRGAPDLTVSDPELMERKLRISRLLAGACRPISTWDTALEGCR